jgi:hypothetical protein
LVILTSPSEGAFLAGVSQSQGRLQDFIGWTFWQFSELNPPGALVRRKSVAAPIKKFFLSHFLAGP